MKHKLTACLVWGAITFCAALGGVGCVVSGFRITQADMGTVVFLCALFSFGFCLVYQFRRLPTVILCLLGLLLGFLWGVGSLSSSVMGLAAHICRYYHRGYGWPLPLWSGLDFSAVPFTQALCLMGGTAALALGRALSRREGIWTALGICLLPLIACCVLNDTVPHAGWLFLLFWGLVVSGISASARHEREKLAAFLALPTLLALSILFLAIPKEGYSLQSGAEKLEQLAKGAMEWLQNPTVPEIRLPAMGELEETVDLAAAGPKGKPNQTVMEVTLAQSGTLYLRGRGFDTYDGKGWSTEVKDENPRYWPNSQNMTQTGTVTIQTRGVHSVLYQPVYPYSITWTTGMEYGCVPNDGRETEYTPLQGTPDSDWVAIALGWDTVEEAWLRLPDNTRLRAQALLQRELGLSFPLSDREKETAAQKIITFVRKSASYDLKTRRMPAGQEDFALWFLEASDTGYCVHFATATAVLMRAAGIPARYVTGYMITGAAGETLKVPAHAAHAWCEYMLPGKIWKIAESTPPAEDSPVSSTQEEFTAPHQNHTSPPASESRPILPQSPGTVTPGTSAGSTFWGILYGLGGILVGMALVFGQWQLRLQLRRARQHRGSPNRRALTRWQESILLSRLSGIPIPEALTALAEKAKFSPHTLSKGELMQFHSYMRSARARLREKPWYYQIYYRLILALY